MLRWYCWLVFFTIAIFSTWALPADEENGVAGGPIIDADENDQQVMDITSRYFRRKPNKNRDDDDDDSSSWDNDKKETKVKCVCLGKKPFAYTLERYPPPRPTKPRPSSGSNNGESSSQRPNGQSGSNTNRPNMS